MHPVVGYKGGKRRLLKRLRPLLPVDQIGSYIEPFVGMGACYLDLRARGFTGPAVLADANPCVADFWRILHSDQADRLVVEAKLLPQTPTAEDYRSVIAAPEPDTIRRVVKFLWITNYAFGNDPPSYVDGRWHATGTKLTSAAKWGQTFPWEKCVTRLMQLCSHLKGAPVVVVDDFKDALALAGPDSFIYADPPYRNTTKYTRGAQEALTDFVAPLVAVGDNYPTLLSEATDVSAELPGWEADLDTIVARVSEGSGAAGHRSEYIFVSPARIRLVLHRSR
jgi:site-specific DNA-adenine methylase